MKTEPLLGATAVGVVIMIVFSVISTIIALNSPTLQGLGSSLTCLVSVAVSLLVGLIYSVLHGREATLSVGGGVKGGAAASALVFFFNGILTVVIGLVLAPQMAEAAVTVAATERAAPIDAEFFSAILPLALFSVACGTMVLGAIFGAVGGAIGGAIFGQSGKSG